MYKSSLLLITLLYCVYVTEGLDFRLGIIMSHPQNENGWSGRTSEGITAATAELALSGINLITEVADNLDPGLTALTIMRSWAQNGVQLIIVNSAEFGGNTYTVATEYPQTFFAQWTASPPNNMPSNMRTFAAYGFLRSYLAGILCSYVSITQNIGWIGPVPAVTGIAHKVRDTNGIYVGVKEQNPQANLVTIETSSWVRPAEEAWAVDLMMENNVDCVHHIQSTPTIPRKLASLGKYVVGWGTLPDELNGNGVSPTWLTSAYLNWKLYIVQYVSAVASGTWADIPGFNLRRDAIDFHPFPANSPVSLEFQNFFNERKQAVFSGTYDPFCGDIVAPINPGPGACVNPLDWYNENSALYPHHLKIIKGECASTQSLGRCSYTNELGYLGYTASIRRGNPSTWELGLHNVNTLVPFATGHHEAVSGRRDSFVLNVNGAVAELKVGRSSVLGPVAGANGRVSLTLVPSKENSTVSFQYLALDNADCVVSNFATNSVAGTKLLTFSDTVSTKLKVYGTYSFIFSTASSSSDAPRIELDWENRLLTSK